jgi:hypothetical protein
LAEILDVGRQIALGLAAAHAKGVVHGDLKPDNVLLAGVRGVQGAASPGVATPGLLPPTTHQVKLTDFGLARAVGVAGTPLYLPPEQARGETADHRSDLFSLGSILYLLCTGRPAFRASTATALLERIRTDTPRPVREVNPNIPAWLSTLVARLHARDPAERFQSAAEVADLLGKHLPRLLPGEPSPRPTTRAAGRRRLAFLAVAALLAVSAGLIPYLLPRDSPPVESPREGARTAPVLPPLPTAQELAARPSPLDGPKHEGVPREPPDLIAVLGDSSGEPVLSLAISPDGRTLASGGRDGTVRLWDLAGGKERRPWTVGSHTGQVWSVVFSPDGSTLASGGQDGRLVLWDAASRKEIRSLHDHVKTLSRIAFSPDGQTLAAGGDGCVRFWDVPTGGARDRLSLAKHGAVRVVAYSREGLLACGGAARDPTPLCGGIVSIWELSRRRERNSFSTGAAITNLAFSPDGKKLAWVGEKEDPRLHLRDVVGGDELVIPGHTDHVGGLAFHPLGRRLATGGQDGTVLLWDGTPPGRKLPWLPPRLFGKAIYQIAFTPEGRYLATANDNGTIALLRLPPE